MTDSFEEAFHQRFLSKEIVETRFESLVTIENLATTQRQRNALGAV